jgi:isopenicillin-N N-acyltransferase like protein
VPLDQFARLFDDHDGFPASICRSQEGASEDATVFNIVMDLERKYGEVVLGRPCHVESRHVLNFKE